MQEKLAKLNKQYNSFRAARSCCIVLLASGTGMLFWHTVAGVALLCAALAVYFLLVRKERQNYSEAVVCENLVLTVANRINSAPPDSLRGGSIDVQTIRDAQLIPFDDIPNAVLLREGLQGNTGNIALSMCDATLLQRNLPGLRTEKNVNFSSGVWLHACLREKSDANWRLVSRNMLPGNAMQHYFEETIGLEEVPLSEGEEELMYFCDASLPATLPGEEVLSAVGELLSYTTGSLAISLHGTEMDLFLKNRFLAQPVSSRTQPTEQLLRTDPLPELQYLTAIVRALEQGKK